MASGSSPDISRRTWISSLELHRLTSSGQSPTSPEVAAVLSLAPNSPLTEDANWFKKVPCCHLKSLEDGGKGQGIIVCLGVDGNQQRLCDILGTSTYPALALLTNHHIIPSKYHAKKWKISVHGMEMRKLNVALDEKRIDACRSCCGRDGVLGRSEHPRAPCPFRADFTILVLSKEFSSELLKNRELKFPVLAPLDMESLKNALQSERFYIFKRDEGTGLIRDVELTIDKVQAPTSDDQQSLDGRITAYKQMCLLRYDINTGVSPGDSGAGIFYKKGPERLLLGLHKSTEESEGCHSGIAIHAVFHAITGGEVCQLIPTLSLLKDGKMYGQLQRSFYDNVRACFEVREGIAVQVSDDVRGEMTLERVIHVLDYILKQELLDLQPGEELTRPSLDLLAAIFDYFRQSDHGTIKERVRTIYPDEKTRKNFYDLVCIAGEKICQLCNDHERREIVEGCFVCWQKLSLFPLHKEVFTKGTNFAKMKHVRNSEPFQDNLIVQKNFGDICLAYQLHIRNKNHMDMQQQREDFEKEREQYENQSHMELQQQREDFEKEREQYEARVKEALQNREAEFVEEGRKKETEIDSLKADFDTEREEWKEKLRNAEQLVVEKSLVLEQLLSERNGTIAELTSKLEQVEGERNKLNTENEELAKQLQYQSPERSSSQPPGRHYSEPAIRPRSSQYPTRRVTPKDNTFERFWERDISDILRRDVALRSELAQYFVKNTGSEGGGTWEHLVAHLNDTKPNFRMNAETLESHPVPEILLSIILEWSKVGGKVTVKDFSEVSKELGIGRVEHVLCEAEKTAYDTPGVEPTGNDDLFSNCHDSDAARV